MNRMTMCSAGLQACQRSRPEEASSLGRPEGLHYMVLLIAALAFVCAPTIARAQAGPPAPKNLQVLPKDTPAPAVVAQMQQFTRALGVQCTYCHVEQTAPLLSVEELQAQQAAAAAQQAAQPQNPQAGQGQQAGRGRGRGRGPQGPQMDYAADEKRQKLTARLMMSMTNDINVRLSTSLKKPAAEMTRVQCATCHRGVPIPAQLSDLLRQTMLGKGEGAAVVQYRELRQQYLDTGAYNFRETTLLDLARESLGARKPDDALAWLQLNVEFYPQSAASYLELARAHLAKRDRDAAVADLAKALTIDPANADAKRELSSLRK
jgi:tetratricopeptide (TPR) repeat protein